MRQLFRVVALVEAVVDFFAQRERVDQTEYAGRPLAGNDRTDERAGAAGFQTVSGKEFDQGFDVVVLYALDFHRQTGGHGNFAAAETVRRFRDGAVFRRGDLAVAGDDADVEHVGITLVAQAAESFDALDVVGCEGSVNGVAHGNSPVICDKFLWFHYITHGQTLSIRRKNIFIRSAAESTAP